MADQITVVFRKGIRADGEIIVMRIVQGDQEIELTGLQAISLADQINAKVQRNA